MDNKSKAIEIIAALATACGGKAHISPQMIGEAVAGQIVNGITLNDGEEIAYLIVLALNKEFVYYKPESDRAERQDDVDDAYAAVADVIDKTLETYGYPPLEANAAPVCNRSATGFRFERNLARDIARGRV